LDQLERRIPNDYPHCFSCLLGAPGNLTSASPTTPFGFAFPDGDPTDPAYDDTFVVGADGYLYLPLGFAGQYEVTMQAAQTGGTSPNYLQPVIGGDVTPTVGILIEFVAYVAIDGVVDTGIYQIENIFRQQTQEPPPYRQGGYDRIWSLQKIRAANNFISAADNRRWALYPVVIPFAMLTGTLNVSGLVMSVTLMPPDGVMGTATWSG
jgi:hypothetical protein